MLNILNQDSLHSCDEITPFVIVAVADAVVPIPTPIRGGALILIEAVPL